MLCFRGADITELVVSTVLCFRGADITELVVSTVLCFRGADITELVVSTALCFRGAAKNCYELKRRGISHVLNTADGPRDGWHCPISAQHFIKPGTTTVQSAPSTTFNQVLLPISAVHYIKPGTTTVQSAPRTSLNQVLLLSNQRSALH